MWQIFLGLLAFASSTPVEDDLFRFGSVRYFQPVPNQILPYGTYKTAAPVQFLQAFPSLFRYQAPTRGVPVAPQAIVPVPLAYGVAPRVHVTQVQPVAPSGGQGPVVSPVDPPDTTGQRVVPTSFQAVRFTDDVDDESPEDVDERRVVIPVQYSVPGVPSGGVVYYTDDDDDDDEDELSRRLAFPVQYRAQGLSGPFARRIYYDDDDDDDDDDSTRLVLPVQYSAGVGVPSVRTPGIVYAVGDESVESGEDGESSLRVPVQYTAGLPYVRAARSIYYGDDDDDEPDEDDNGPSKVGPLVPTQYGAPGAQVVPVVYAEESGEDPDDEDDPPRLRGARTIYYGDDDDGDDGPDDDGDDGERVLVPVQYSGSSYAGVYRTEDVDDDDDDDKK